MPAHPSDERVRGGLGDRVDARDVAGDGYKYLSRLVMEAGRCRAVDPLLRRSRHPAGPISTRNSTDLGPELNRSRRGTRPISASRQAAGRRSRSLTMEGMSERNSGARLRVWERASEWPLTAAALVFLAVYAWEVIVDLRGAARAGVEMTMDVVWMAFIADYVVRLALAPNRGRWFLRHLLDLAVVVLPVLRPLRLLRLVALLGVLQRGAGIALRGRITAYTAGGVSLLILLSSLAVLDAERGAPGTPITTFGEAVWWSLVTITTIGYGDLAPVTAVGRCAAVLLMVGGVALAGVVTATLASWIVSLVAEEGAEQEAATRAQVEALQQQVAVLSERVELLVEASTPPPAAPAASAVPPEPARPPEDVAGGAGGSNGAKGPGGRGSAGRAGPDVVGGAGDPDGGAVRTGCVEGGDDAVGADGAHRADGSAAR